MPSGDPGRNVHTNFKSYAINTTVSKKSRVSALAGLESSAIRSQLSNAFSNQSPVRHGSSAKNLSRSLNFSRKSGGQGFGLSTDAKQLRANKTFVSKEDKVKMARVQQESSPGVSEAAPAIAGKETASIFDNNTYDGT